MPRLFSLLFLFAAGPVFAADAAPAAAPPAPVSASEIQDELSASLRSYTLLKQENDSLKDAATKDAADKADLQAQLESARQAIAELQAQAAAAAHMGALETQLRQTQEQLAAVIAENAALRRQLAAAGPAPYSRSSVPTRPPQN